MSEAARGHPKQFSFEYSSVFQDESVVRAYRYRPMYPPQVFPLLAELLPNGCAPRAVLDTGCGTGFVARPLAPLVDRVDAVDFSAAAIREGKRLPGGDHPHLRWMEGPIESVALHPPYCLITAGASVHWFDWGVVFPRFARLLAQNGLFVVVGMSGESPAWMEELRPVFARYSMNRDFAPYSAEGILAELEERGLFELLGSVETEPVEWQQSISEWVESIHARNGFSRDRMEAQEAAKADALFTEIAQRHCPDEIVRFRYGGRLRWGRPLDPAAG